MKFCPKLPFCLAGKRHDLTTSVKIWDNHFFGKSTFCKPTMAKKASKRTPATLISFNKRKTNNKNQAKKRPRPRTNQRIRAEDAKNKNPKTGLDNIT